MWFRWMVNSTQNPVLWLCFLEPFLEQVSLENIVRQGLKKGSCFIWYVQTQGNKNEENGTEERKQWESMQNDAQQGADHKGSY